MSEKIDIESLTPMEKIQFEFYLQVLTHLSASTELLDSINAKLHGEEGIPPEDRSFKLGNRIDLHEDFWPSELLKLKLLSKLS